LKDGYSLVLNRDAYQNDKMIISHTVNTRPICHVKLRFFYGTVKPAPEAKFLDFDA
jgi:hypothetical protein